MGDHQQEGKPSHYVTSHPGQLNLAIPPWASAMITSKCTPHDALAPCSWSNSVNWCLAKETKIITAICAYWLGKNFTFFYAR